MRPASDTVFALASDASSCRPRLANSRKRSGERRLPAFRAWEAEDHFPASSISTRWRQAMRSSTMKHPTGRASRLSRNGRKSGSCSVLTHIRIFWPNRARPRRRGRRALSYRPLQGRSPRQQEKQHARFEQSSGMQTFRGFDKRGEAWAPGPGDNRKTVEVCSEGREDVVFQLAPGKHKPVGRSQAGSRARLCLFVSS